MTEVLECVAVIVAWVVVPTGVLIAADKLVKALHRRRRDKAAAEQLADRVDAAIGDGDRDGLLYALGLISPIDPTGLPWFDAVDLEAVRYPAEIIAVPRQRDGGAS